MKNKIFHLIAGFNLILLFSNSINAQIITEKPIYKGSSSLTIKELSGGSIYFGYQNPDYTTIVDIVSFSTYSKAKAIELIEKAINILEMEKTDRDQNIQDSFDGVDLIRYGFWQNRINLSDGKESGLVLSMKECNKIREALMSYEYINQINKN
jgi:hypothetical protein